MRIEDGDKTSDSDRTAIDRRAISAAGQLLMSAIWLEHRVRRVSTRLNASHHVTESGSIRCVRREVLGCSSIGP